MTSGICHSKILLMYMVVIPSNVSIIEVINGRVRQYINPENAIGNTYKITVGSEMNLDITYGEILVDIYRCLL